MCRKLSLNKEINLLVGEEANIYIKVDFIYGYGNLSLKNSAIRIKLLLNKMMYILLWRKGTREEGRRRRIS